MLLLFLSVILWTVLCESREPEEKSGISFGHFFICDETERGKPLFCLTETFKPGVTVVLMDRMGMCAAKTGGTLTYVHPAGDFEVTRVEGTDERPKNPGGVAVVGTDPSAIRLVSPKDAETPLAKARESEARTLLKSEDLQQVWPISDAPPRVLAAGNVALLIFPSENKAVAPVLLLVNQRIIRLEGWCTSDHVLFTVQGKLHLSYQNFCCGCGWSDVLVYDLSGEIPKKVYVDGALSM